MLADATIGIDQHSHTHTLSLSVSPLPCCLSSSFLTLYKLVWWLCVYQLKYRFHRIWLFSFPKAIPNKIKLHVRTISTLSSLSTYPQLVKNCLFIWPVAMAQLVDKPTKYLNLKGLNPGLLLALSENR